LPFDPVTIGALVGVMAAFTDPAKTRKAISVPNMVRARKLLEKVDGPTKPGREDEWTGGVVMVNFCSQLVKRKRKMKNRRRKVLGVLRR
jgi:hypothetical protein